MSKSAKRRHHTHRLRKKWLNLLLGLDPNRDVKCTTFGRIFSGDPIDCGSPRCPLCSWGKVFRSKESRIKNRKEEREQSSYLDLL